MTTTTNIKYKNGYCAAMNHALFLHKFISVHAHPNCMSLGPWNRITRTEEAQEI